MALLISDLEGVKIVAAAGKKAIATGADAGKVAREMSRIVGGGGGGRPDMARGGGVDSSKAAEAMEKGISMVKASLNVKH
jgi:alanyl-tRNA synthetase